MGGAAGDAWKAQQDAAARLAEVWAEVVESTARGATRSFTAAGGEPMAALARQAADYAAVAARPLRDMVEGQRAFAEHVGRWAEMQREIADGMATWAAQQQEHLDALDRLIPPYGS